jgi:cytochrome c oxidase cbb3-type subunit 3
VLVCRLVPGQEGTKPQPKPTPADLVEGERIFGAQCSFCHGPNGAGGGVGPALAVSRLPHAPNDQALFEVIREGIPNTQMPANVLTNAQTWQVVAYLRTLGRAKEPKSTGDPRQGEEVYLGNKAACTRCHTIHGQGGAIGPDLAGIGAREKTSFIRTSILDPEASVPPDFLQLRVVTKDGQRLTGVRVNEDTFSIQIRDLSNQLHSFWKTELTELVKEPNKSPMPSYRNVLSSQEIENVVAYLESLKGHP